MTAKLSRPQRRALEGLERGATLAATHPTVIAALRAKGLITEHDHVGRHKITDAGLARLHLRRGRRPGPARRAELEFMVRQLELPLELPR